MLSTKQMESDQMVPFSQLDHARTAMTITFHNRKQRKRRGKKSCATKQSLGGYTGQTLLKPDKQEQQKRHREFWRKTKDSPA